MSSRTYATIADAVVASSASLAGIDFITIFGDGDYSTVPQFGPELVTNGTMATDTGWPIKTNGFSISGGVAVKAAGSGFGDFQQPIAGIIGGATYRLGFQIKSFSAGSLTSRLVGGTPAGATGRSAVGTYTNDFVANAGNNALNFTANASTVLTFDDVSLREVMLGFTTADGRKWYRALVTEAEFVTPIAAKTADYTVLHADRGTIITVSAAGASRTVTLPGAVAVGNGWSVTIKRSDAVSNTNIVTVAAASGEFIEADGPVRQITSVINQGGTARAVYDDYRTLQWGDYCVVTGVPGAPSTPILAAFGTNSEGATLTGVSYATGFTSGTIKRVQPQVTLRAYGDSMTFVSDGTGRWHVTGADITAHRYRDILFGHVLNYKGTDTSSSNFVADLAFLPRFTSLFAKAFRATDVNDPPDICMRRMEIGNDGIGETVLPDQLLGHLFWQGSIAKDGGQFEGTNAAIYARARGVQTDESSPGSLILASTRVDETNYRDGLEVDDQQRVHLAGNASARAVMVQREAATSFLRLRNNSDNQVTVEAEGSASHVTLNLHSKGTGDVDVYSDGGSLRMARFGRVAGADRCLTFQPSNGGNPVIGATGGNVAVDTPLALKSYQVNTLPAQAAGSMIYVSNAAGGAVPAYSDGANWRRVTDATVIN